MLRCASLSAITIPIGRAVSHSPLFAAAGDVLPRSVEATTCASEQAFLFLFLQIRVDLVLVEARRAEERQQEHEEIDTCDRVLVTTERSGNQSGVQRT